MGRVRTVYIKRTAKELIEKYPDKFDVDFEKNKQVLNQISKYKSKVIRNKIAGAIVHLIKMEKEVQENE